MKLYHNDCFEVMGQIFDEGKLRFDAIIADPPYGILNQRAHWDTLLDAETLWRYLNAMAKPNAPIILFSDEPFTHELIRYARRDFKYKIYWQKTQATGFLNAKKQPLKCIEEILVFYNGQCTYNPQKTQGHKPVNSYTKYLKTVNKSVVYGKQSKELSGGGNTDRYPRQLVTFKSDKQTNYLHPTQKPLALMEYLVKTYTNPGDQVLDFVMGSGTTGLACKNLDRHFTGIENDEKYFKIAQDRLC